MKHRSVQHREQPDTKSKAKELAELKREIHSLKRQNARLKKELSKYDGSRSVVLDPEPMVVAPEISPDAVPVRDDNQCPACGSDAHMTSVLLPTGQMLGCKNCGWRKKKEAA